MQKITSNTHASLDEQEQVEHCFICGEALDEVAGCSCPSSDSEETEACDCSECD
jgi:hypothetical protein